MAPTGLYALLGKEGDQTSMKPFQTLLLLTILILIGGMVALYWGKVVQDVSSPVEVIDDATVPASIVDEPVEEPGGDQNTPSQPTPSASTSPAISPIILVDNLPEHNDAFGFVTNEAGQSVWVEEDILYVNVGYGGGCQEHEFTMYWSGLWAESAPPQTGVRLVHESNDDFCEAYLTQTLQFDMSSITSVYRPLYFTVVTNTESISLFIE